MNIKNKYSLVKKQVCSLELAKELKKLKISQKSLFYWVKIGNKFLLFSYIDVKFFTFKVEKYSAYTAGELGNLLPEGYHTYKTGFSGIYEWEACDIDDKMVFDENSTSIMANTEANCRAKLLIHLTKKIL
jgi:hypothetical protein